MIDVLIAIGLFGFAIVGVISLVVFANISTIHEEKEQSDPCIRNIYISKIKNGSKLIIGKDCFTTVIKVNQRFNWLQKKMWKILLGIKIEDYSED